MFEVGKEYRVVSMKEGLGNREGVMLASEGPVFTIDVDGVRTTFHMASVAYVQLIDRAVEDANAKARADAWTKALS